MNEVSKLTFVQTPKFPNLQKYFYLLNFWIFWNRRKRTKKNSLKRLKNYYKKLGIKEEKCYLHLIKKFKY